MPKCVRSSHLFSPKTASGADPGVRPALPSAEHKNVTYRTSSSALEIEILDAVL
jgi:hypothetical protein